MKKYIHEITNGYAECRIEADYLGFNAGAAVEVGVADVRGRLVC